MTNKNKTKSGSGLIFAVILLFVILAMVVTLASVTVLETKMGQKTKSSVGAFYNSESGVEWALNRIATGAGPNISNVFGSSFSATTGKVTCPPGFGCELYLIDSQGKVIASDITIDQVKAVRSIGTQNVGGTADTQRAIEAAVASVDFPPGMIVIWSGATIPTGWALCDGANGTPDLRGRFIYGGSSGDTTGTQGSWDSGWGGTNGGAHDLTYYVKAVFIMKL